MARANSCLAQQSETLKPAVDGNGAVLRALATSTAVSPEVCYQESGDLGKSGRPKSQRALESGGLGKPTAPPYFAGFCATTKLVREAALSDSLSSRPLSMFGILPRSEVGSREAIPFSASVVGLFWKGRTVAK